MTVIHDQLKALSKVRENAATLGLSRGALGSLILFSFFSNILMLTVPIYMLQIYDRVLGSRSLETLYFLTLAAVTALLVYMGLEIIRSRLLLRLGMILENDLGGPLLANALSTQAPGHSPGIQNVRDLQEIRNLFSGGMLNTVLDSPWLPVYILVLFLFHPVYGWIGIVSSITLAAIIIISEMLSRQAMLKANRSNLHSLSGADVFLRNAETIRALGMTPEVQNRWQQLSRRSLKSLSDVASRLGVSSNLAKFIRLIVQIAALGSGVYLVLQNELTPGLMIAGSILIARALSPLEAAIGSWRPLVSGFQAYQRLRTTLERTPTPLRRQLVERPAGKVSLDKVTYLIRGAKRTPLNNVSFQLNAGTLLGVAGPIGAGKTTLAKILVGINTPSLGKVFLDNQELSSWDPDELGKYIGYAPQEVQVFSGTVADNIARYNSNFDMSKVVQAGKRAFAHDIILDLPQGYETLLEDAGVHLSSGLKQRISLARALYGDPRLIVLDEPESFLDARGEADLSHALRALRRARVTTVVVTHRPTILSATEKMLVLEKGVAKAFGPTKEVLPLFTKETAEFTRGQSSDRKPPRPQKKQLQQSQRQKNANRINAQATPTDPLLQQDQRKAAEGKLTLSEFIDPKRGSYGRWLMMHSGQKGQTLLNRLHHGFRDFLKSPLSKIKAIDIEKWRSARREESKVLSGTLERANARHRSEQDIRLLQSCLQRAVEWKLLPRNPLLEPSVEEDVMQPSESSETTSHKIQTNGGMLDG